MIVSAYLDLLDQMLRPGLSHLGDRFVRSQVALVLSFQQPDGGFAGRRGGSDPYYTDFALRTLAWLAPHHVAFAQSAEFLGKLSGAPRDAVECFSRLNAFRLMNQNGVAATPADLSAWIGHLERQCLCSGGLVRRVGDGRISAYHTFLGQLCFEMLSAPMPNCAGAVSAIGALQQNDGGFAESAGYAQSQTNATAAAAAFLLLHDALTPNQAASIGQFLMRMRTEEGGFRAHEAAPASDLLSTFTGLVTLAAIERLDAAILAGAARFLRDMAHPQGGFLAGIGDDCADLEYTHYGIAAMALLRSLSLK